MGKKRKTAGSVVLDLLKKTPDTRDPQELIKAQAEDYQRVVLETTEEGKKIYKKDFFVVSLCKKEPLIPNIMRNLIHHRESCPTPTHDQTVYHFVRNDNQLFFLWTIPDFETATIIRENVLNIAPDEHWLRDIVIDFYDGTLDKLCDTLNGKKFDAILYKKGEYTHG